ncbi:DUF5995 family protein [Pseudofrankia asymbiotica]|uniref:Uncharacterized protein n=1 Tax=Pseudofrankia asymbiotica TaxID=1834516 RepID=A0A1V2I6A4_9ACTN|nr:DUF5995 family protein [Pseudofrankia asymbiotica]ONH26621.1 hypothetical protein BL253_24250 [Pseudofrankia asymbiotica]
MAATAALGGGPARADMPVELTGVPAYRPSLSAWYTPGQIDHCLGGNPDCVPVTVARMDAILSQLAATCDHRAPFTLAYLRTTQQYQQSAATPGFFQDPAFVNVEDVFFASYFFSAYDNWNANNTSAVPRAWQVAFSAARDRSVSGLGDILLGMNAHINRDLPYVLAGLGLVSPDGTSRHDDHERVNILLDQVAESMLDEAAARLDPTINDLKSPHGITYKVFMQIIAGWREAAWINGRRLVGASAPGQRALVEASIDQTATAIAIALRTVFLHPPAQTSVRDSYCASHHG